MSESSNDLFGSEIKFAAVPAEEIPNNALALSRILAAERGVRQLYRNLEKAARGEAVFFLGALQGDWEKRFGELLTAGESLLGELGHPRREEEVLPVPAQLEKIAASLKEAVPAELVKALGAFNSRALLCSRLVPWVSDVQEVFDHFKRSLEAEDQHMAVLDLFSDLLEPRGE
jgi:hypothetical protein